MYLLDYAMPIIPRSIPIIASRKGMVSLLDTGFDCYTIHLGNRDSNLASFCLFAFMHMQIPMETIQHRCALVYLGVFSGVLKPIPLTSAVAAPLISPPKQSGIGP